MVSFVSRRRFKRVAVRSVSVPSAVTPEVSDQLASTSTSAGQRQGAASLVLALRISMRWLVVNAELPGPRWTWSALWRSRSLCGRSVPLRS